MARALALKVTGTVERDPPIFWDDRGIGLLKLVEHEKPIRIKELQRPELPKDLKPGDKITAEINEDDRYYSLISLERERAASPLETSSSAGISLSQAEQPPKTYTPTRDKGLPPTPGKGRACSARFMAKFRELVKKGLGIQQLVDELCLQEREIYDLKRALDVKEEIEQRVRTSAVKIDTDFDTIRPSHYVELAKVSDPDKQFELAKKVAEEQLSVSKLRKEIKGEEPEPPPPPRPEWIDQGITLCCKTCGESFRLLHLTEGRHKLEPVMVVEKQ